MSPGEMTRQSAVLVLVLMLAACGSSGGSSDSSGGGGSGGSGGGGSGGGGGSTPTQAQIEALGKMLFEDVNLSNPAGQSCASCHDASVGFADPDNGVPVSAGADGSSLGSRNSPTVSYAAFIPVFSTVNNGGTIINRGGQFLDGRAPTLEEQAKIPFLSVIEMNMADRAAVIDVIENASYADDFRTVYGDDAFDDVDQAYENMAEAIAEFQRSDEVSPFSSKFDDVQDGSDSFTVSEANGEQVFIDNNCGRCHSNDGVDPVFSNFEYENIGVPSNAFVTANSLDGDGNPVGMGFVDLGLGAITGEAADNGKFRTPTLRNVELTAPYMHNGVFDTLEQVVEFYDMRDPALAEVPATVTNEDIGTPGAPLGLTPAEKADLVAFLRTLTDR